MLIELEDVIKKMRSLSESLANYTPEQPMHYNALNQASIDQARVSFYEKWHKSSTELSFFASELNQDIDMKVTRITIDKLKQTMDSLNTAISQLLNLEKSNLQLIELCLNLQTAIHIFETTQFKELLDSQTKTP